MPIHFLGLNARFRVLSRFGAPSSPSLRDMRDMRGAADRRAASASRRSVEVIWKSPKGNDVFSMF
jgi:hypothetical protein